MDRCKRLNICAGLVLAAAWWIAPALAAGEKPHWSYEGAEGPEQWGTLDEDYATCGAGLQQSPIDLTSHTPAALGDVAIDWKPASASIVNNGHTVQANMDNGGKITIGNKSFTLLQFHFHHKSEHSVDGEQLPMELHFVHGASDGSLAVLGVFLEAGGETGRAVDSIEAMWKLAPGEKGEASSKITIDPLGLLPSKRSYFRYYGSLTTPPCSEIVTWTVYDTPVKIEQGQIDSFASLFENNARPVQPLNRRFLLGTN